MIGYHKHREGLMAGWASVRGTCLRYFGTVECNDKSFWTASLSLSHFVAKSNSEFFLLARQPKSPL